jgi:hypothetical protein
VNVLDAVKQVALASAVSRLVGGHHYGAPDARSHQFERSLIRARPGKGRERAKARGRSVRTAAEVHSAPEAGGGRAFKAGEAVMEIARIFGVDRATIYSPE